MRYIVKIKKRALPNVMDLKCTTQNFLHISPQNFFPLTLSLSQNFSKFFSLSLFHLGISWALSLSFSLSLSQYSLFLPSLIFDLSTAIHCIATHCHSHPLPPPSSLTSTLWIDSHLLRYPPQVWTSNPSLCLSPFVLLFFFLII